MVETQPRTAAEISRAQVEARYMDSVVVDIYDQIYQLRGVKPEYIERLAEVVDLKMRAVSAHGSTVDSLRVAVLAALNLADELVTLRARYEALIGAAEAHRQAAAQSMVRSRAGSLMGMLDEVLENRKAG
ncbi:cell division protein ZapA [Granulicella sp. L46]|jgi:cell division protein ZapA|uniref:cell division protein ZapA n=1 Tax=Granulicella sp. L46 TaxID=1641865 RepID=UPI00131ABD1C|nr:cell division protein ZapA [Granulicella sp. L46]